MSRRRKKRSRSKLANSLYSGSDTPPCTSAGAQPAPAPVAVATLHGSPAGTRSAPCIVPVFSADAPHPQIEGEDGQLVFVNEDHARRLMLNGKATFIRKSKHIRGIKIIPDIVRDPQRGGTLHSGTLGDPHASDSLNNCVGVWTIEACGKKPSNSSNFLALPRWASRELFSRPVVDCLSKRAA